MSVHHHSPSSLPEKQVLGGGGGAQARECGQHLSAAAAILLQQAPPPADPTEGFPFEGAWRNKILSNHLSTLLSFILLNDQPCVCVPLTGKTLQLIFAY